MLNIVLLLIDYTFVFTAPDQNNSLEDFIGLILKIHTASVPGLHECFVIWTFQTVTEKVIEKNKLKSVFSPIFQSCAQN